MTTAVAQDLEARAEAAWTRLSAQLVGMSPFLERSDGPGEWTTREVLSHLLFEPGWDAVALLRTFAHSALPVIEIEPGDPFLSPERRRMTLEAFVEALEDQRRSVFAYLKALSEADLARKARIPLFKAFMGTDEVPIPVFVGAMFEYHIDDHAQQLAKIRDAVGLPPAS
jgi:DinB superfamily